VVDVRDDRKVADQFLHRTGGVGAMPTNGPAKSARL
jgi:hypothetical protein